MDINLPTVLAEVSAAVARFEQALAANDNATLLALFWHSPHTVRCGVHDSLQGHAQISAYREARRASGLARRVLDTVVTTYGHDFATAHTAFQREGSPTIGRQSQTWVRMPEGWRVVAQHVSLLPGAA